MDIQIARAGEIIGTFTLEQVEQQISQGLLNPDDQFWKEGMVDWKPLQHLNFYVQREQTPPPLPTPAPATVPIMKTDIGRQTHSAASLKVTGFLMIATGVIMAAAAGALRADSGDVGAGTIVCGVIGGLLFFVGFILFVAGRLRQ